MRILSAFAFTLLFALPARAQEPAVPPPGGEELVDRVVAVVGDTALLFSDVQEEIERLRSSGQPIPTDPQTQAQLFQDVLRARIDDLVLLEAARGAGVSVDDREVEQVVDQEIQQIRSRFPSEAAFTAALAQSGMTLDEFRRARIEENRAQAVIQRFIQQRSGAALPAPVAEEEIREFFEAQRERLGTRPATVSFRQVVVRPAPSDSAKAAAKAEAEQVLEELRTGGDFEVLARRFSDDPGTRERGGDLGWFRQGQMVRPFEAVAFAMRPGMVSPIVETVFGYHIIKLEKVRGGERQARHILIRPEMTEADRERARTRAEEAAQAARAGTAMADLAERYETPADQRTAENVPVDRLPPAFSAALGEAQAGEVVGPFRVEGGPGEGEWVVLKIRERKAAGAYTLEDVREQVRERIQQQKAVQQLLEELRERTYIHLPA